MRKAAGTDYTPRQARELEVWVNTQKAKQDLYIDVTTPEVRKQDEEDLIVRAFFKSGFFVTALAIIVGIVVFIVNVPRLLGWW